ncbi:hypothetical protein BDV96DRAFT_602110 [Lophiotrema nucula]|uniref:Uncharacterized protein n=1 Tax=Lophiotrema nucula TaxID=690887 RepID=A0A6A5Z0W2_9PLEO|nr:hypothetical protein BDV96DRAFT_602110 [Lophiotrema nucula]
MSDPKHNTECETYLVFDFDKINKAHNGGYTFTRERLAKSRKLIMDIKEIQAEQQGRQLRQKRYVDSIEDKEVQRIYSVEIDDIFGITVTLHIDTDFEYMVGLYGLFGLANNNPLQSFNDEPERSVLRYCPFYPTKTRRDVESGQPLELLYNHIATYNKDWRDSGYSKLIEDALIKSLPAMPEVDKVVCFNIKSFDHSSAYSHSHHLAARKIAEVIGHVQGENRKGVQEIPVYLQSKFYTREIQKVLPALEYRLLDYCTAEGLEMVDEKTFVIALEPYDETMQACIGLTDGLGPAGMLTVQRSIDHEKWWSGQTLPTSKAAHPLDAWITTAELRYRKNCIQIPFETVKDNPWFDLNTPRFEGLAPTTDGRHDYRLEWLFRKKELSSG